MALLFRTGIHRRLLVGRRVASCAILIGSIFAAGAQTSEGWSAADLKRLSIEELMEVQVTTVSRRPESQARAASAITVLTQEEIERAGAVTIPDALRLVPGVHVSRFAGYSHAISVRGFNSIAANKLQVMMDGRTLYTPLLSGVFWELQDTFMHDIDRIEVVRGPGATLWGANAVNGVINIITKPAWETQGTLLSGGAGNEHVFGAIRYGGRAGENTFYRAYLKLSEFDGNTLQNGSWGEDFIEHGQAGFRSDTRLAGEDNLLTLQGDLYSSRGGLRVRGDAEAAGGNFLARFTRTFSDTSELQIQAFYDRGNRQIPLQFSEERDTVDFDLVHRFALGDRHQVNWGLGYRYSVDDTGRDSAFRFDPHERSLQWFSGFLQDEIILVPDILSLTLGSKIEHNDFTGFEVQPGARAAWSPAPEHTLWAAVSRAVRTPTRIEDDVRLIPNLTSGLVALQGSRAFESEDLLAYELGYRARPWKRVTGEIALFYHDYDNLRTQEPTPPFGVPLVLANRLEAESWGAELNLVLELTHWWSVRAGYAFFEKDLQFDPDSRDPTRGAGEGNDPSHMAVIHASINLPRDIAFDAVVRFVDSLPEPAVPSYTALDLRLGWQPRRNLELALIARNILDNRHREWGAANPVAAEVERSFLGTVTWRF